MKYDDNIMALLSINVNKFALLRNARGTDNPNLISICKKCIEFGAQGITVHPKPRRPRSNVAAQSTTARRSRMTESRSVLGTTAVH